MAKTKEPLPLGHAESKPLPPVPDHPGQMTFLASDTDLPTAKQVAEERAQALPDEPRIIDEERPPLMPVGDFLIVKPLPRPTHTKGGLVIPQQSHDPDDTERGTVIRMGSGARAALATLVGVGDVVMYMGSMGLNITEGGTRCLMLKHTDIVGKEVSDADDAARNGPRCPDNL